MINLTECTFKRLCISATLDRHFSSQPHMNVDKVLLKNTIVMGKNSVAFTNIKLCSLPPLLFSSKFTSSEMIGGRIILQKCWQAHFMADCRELL